MSENGTSEAASSGVGRTVRNMIFTAIGMFGFAFALVPIYDMICEVTGLGGRTGGAYEYDAASVAPDKSRLIRVNFVTNTNDGMSWSFAPEVRSVRVHPGTLKTVVFQVRNPTDRVMVGQAVPSVTPMRAAEHFHKTECFCFEQQVLQPGETMDMPMRFIVGPELPRSVDSIALSYTLFDVTEGYAGTLPENNLNDESS